MGEDVVLLRAAGRRAGQLDLVDREAIGAGDEVGHHARVVVLRLVHRADEAIEPEDAEQQGDQTDRAAGSHRSRSPSRSSEWGGTFSDFRFGRFTKRQVGNLPPRQRRRTIQMQPPIDDQQRDQRPERADRHRSEVGRRATACSWTTRSAAARRSRAAHPGQGARRQVVVAPAIGAERQRSRGSPPRRSRLPAACRRSSPSRRPAAAAATAPPASAARRTSPTGSDSRRP